jgi:hypothetical protein
VQGSEPAENVLSSDSDSESDPDEPEQEAGDVLDLNGVKWKKGAGRNVDPFRVRGWNRPAELRLFNYTERKEVDYFQACFPSDLVTQIAEATTLRGQQLGLGHAWKVTPGEIWQFLGYNLAVMLFHTGGPKADLWLSEGGEKYREALFAGPNLGQYGVDYGR